MGTAYARVDHVKLGEADLTGQPFLVLAQIEFQPGLFGVDTGNGAYTLIFPKWAEYGIARKHPFGLPIPTGGVGGRDMASVFHAEKLMIGEATIYGPLVMLTRADAGATGNPTEAGNLGQDILSRFNVHFDYRREQMSLAPRVHPPKAQPASAYFTASKDEKTPDRFQVTWVLKGGPAAKAGLKVGDVLLAINDTPAAKVGFGALKEATTHQPDGAKVRLRLADGRTLEVSMSEASPGPE